MPILPLSHPEPFTAVLGVMLHPREEDQAKAEALAFQYLGAPLEKFHRRGGELPRSDLERLAESGRLLTDLDSEKRWYQATAAGQILKTYFGLCNTDPGLATLENVIKIAERVAGQHGKSGSRSSLRDCWSQYRSVAHLWGAWVLRDLRFMEKPFCGGLLRLIEHGLRHRRNGRTTAAAGRQREQGNYTLTPGKFELSARSTRTRSTGCAGRPPRRGWPASAPN